MNSDMASNNNMDADSQSQTKAQSNKRRKMYELPIAHNLLLPQKSNLQPLSEPPIQKPSNKIPPSSPSPSPPKIPFLAVENVAMKQQIEHLVERNIKSDAMLTQPAMTEEEKSECILCQRLSRKIIFEPCGHILLCVRCSKWACPEFCPHCRMQILKRRQVGKRDEEEEEDCRQIEVLSAYSFMPIE